MRKNLNWESNNRDGETWVDLRFLDDRISIDAQLYIGNKEAGVKDYF